jgi:hypothetical protein
MLSKSVIPTTIVLPEMTFFMVRYYITTLWDCQELLLISEGYLILLVVPRRIV